LTPRVPSEIIVTAGRSGREVVPCFWQRGGPLRLANDKIETRTAHQLRGYFWSGRNLRKWQVKAPLATPDFEV
jgi:hypothetical protein